MTETIDELTLTKIALCDEQMRRLEAEKQLILQHRAAVIHDACDRFGIDGSKGDKILLERGGEIVRAPRPVSGEIEAEPGK